jgi:hypothetical protein
MMHCTVLYVSFIENVHFRVPFVSGLGLGFSYWKTTLSCVIFLKLFSNVCLPVDSLIPLTLSLSLGHSFLSGVENTESFWLILREPYRANHYQISGRGNWPPKCILPVVSQIFWSSIICTPLYQPWGLSQQVSMCDSLSKLCLLMRWTIILTPKGNIPCKW